MICSYPVVCRTYSEYSAPIEDWSDILELAHEWAFVQVRRLAIRELQKLTMPTAERIALYLKFQVGCEYLVPLYVELCSRSETLGLDEAELIGLPVAIIIFRLREELRVWVPRSPPPPPPPESPLPVGITQDDVRARVVNAFGFPPEVANQPGVVYVHPSSFRLLTFMIDRFLFCPQPTIYHQFQWSHSPGWRQRNTMESRTSR